MACGLDCVLDKAEHVPAGRGGVPDRSDGVPVGLEAGRYGEAPEAYRATLVREPGRARSLFGAARAAELTGDRAAAKAGYREFLALLSRADGERAELSKAKKFLRP